MPSIMDILTGAGAALDLPGSSIRDVLAGKNPIDQYKTPFSFDNRTMGRGLLEQYGLLSPNRPGLDAGDVAGFGVEMATDPLGMLLGGGAARAGHRGLLGAARQSARNPVMSMAGTGAMHAGGQSWDEVLPVIQRQAQEKAQGLQRDIFRPGGLETALPDEFAPPAGQFDDMFDDLVPRGESPMDSRFHLNTLAARTMIPWARQPSEKVMQSVSPAAYKGAFDTHLEGLGDLSRSIPYGSARSMKTGLEQDPIDAMRSLFPGSRVYPQEEAIIPMRRAYQSQAATFGADPSLQRDYQNMLEIMMDPQGFNMRMPEAQDWLRQIEDLPERRLHGGLLSTQVLRSDPDYLKSGLGEIGGSRIKDEWAFTRHDQPFHQSVTEEMSPGNVLHTSSRKQSGPRPAAHMFETEGREIIGDFDETIRVPQFFTKIGDEVHGPFLPDNPYQDAWSQAYDKAFFDIHDTVSPVIREGIPAEADFNTLFGREAGPLYQMLIGAGGAGGAAAAQGRR